MERWLPPDNMLGEMLKFDFREGGSYRMRLTYTAQEQGQGQEKTSAHSDEVEVRLTKIEDGRRIEQAVTFQSNAPSFSGVRRVIWTFDLRDEGTLVMIRAENVPEGIGPEDRDAGLHSSLEKRAKFVE